MSVGRERVGEHGFRDCRRTGNGNWDVEFLGRWRGEYGSSEDTRTVVEVGEGLGKDGEGECR